MRFEILLSCMNQTDFSLVSKSQIKSPVLLINQANQDKEEEQDSARMIWSQERGLSKSRNLALKHAKGEICLLSDDDETFLEDVEETICQAYEKLPDADLIIFKISNQPNRLGDKIRRLKRLDSLKVSSWQISFRLSSVQDKIFFDENLGAGTGNGAGEENKFILDCIAAGLKVYYVPSEIAVVAQNIEHSTWFKGYTKDYFYQRGRTTRYLLGLPLASLYACHFLWNKRQLYRKDLSLPRASLALFKGLIAERIE